MLTFFVLFGICMSIAILNSKSMQADVLSWVRKTKCDLFGHSWQVYNEDGFLVRKCSCCLAEEVRNEDTYEWREIDA